MKQIKCGFGGIALAVLAALAGVAPAAAAEEPPEASGGSFFESFDRISPATWYISNGWTNGLHQNCTWSAKNLRIENGVLDLILNKNPEGMAPLEKASEERAYSCAELGTTKTYGYGTYEVRMKAAAAPGLVSAFFSYIGPYEQHPHDEIDFEFLGKEKRFVQVNYYGSAQGGHEKMVDLGFDASEEMADYAFEWRPDAIRWYVNGKLMHESKPEDGKPYPVTPSKIILSLWASDTLHEWLQPFIYPGKPLVASYDWVAFTKLGEGCQFPESVLCKTQKRSDATGN